MSPNQTIPNNIEERLKHFQEEVTRYFPFLSEYGYILDEVKSGWDNRMHDYNCRIIYKNGETKIDIKYSTDILKGNLDAYPNEKQRPVIDNLISIHINDPNAFMFINQFAKTI